jgi:hypothetical protein
MSVRLRRRMMNSSTSGRFAVRERSGNMVSEEFSRSVWISRATRFTDGFRHWTSGSRKTGYMVKSRIYAIYLWCDQLSNVYVIGWHAGMTNAKFTMLTAQICSLLSNGH